MRHVLFLLVAGLVWSSVAFAHGPETAIGRAVAALRAGNVSYDPASPLSEVDAGAIERQLPEGRDVAVAIMPSQALSEVRGGPDQIAREVAREAARTGTVVVVAGTRLGAWSGQIPSPRLAELVRATAGAVPVQAVVELASRVANEGQVREDGGSGSGVWIVAASAGALAVLAAGAYALRRRTRLTKP